VIESRGDSQMQPVLDAGRGTLTLPRRLVPTVMLLGSRPGAVEHDASLRDLVELERAGIAPGRRLHPLAAAMLDVITEPRHVITVHVERAEGTEISTLWIRHTDVVLGRPAGPEVFQLRPLEVGLLPFHLAQLVAVVARQEPAFDGSITIPAEVLDDGAAMAVADPDGAMAALLGEGVDAEWAERVVEIHQRMVARWRIGSLWVDRDGTPHDGAVEILDADTAGYWQVLTDPAGDTITLAARRFGDILELLGLAGRTP
jgi:hypothetical protein